MTLNQIDLGIIKAYSIKRAIFAHNPCPFEAFSRGLRAWKGRYEMSFTYGIIKYKTNGRSFTDKRM